MLVRNASLALESYSEYQRSQQNLSVTLENGRMVDDGTQAQRVSASLSSSFESRQESIQVRISQYAQNLLKNEQNNPSEKMPALSNRAKTSKEDDLDDASGDGKLFLLKKLLEALTGKSFDMPAFDMPDGETGDVFTAPVSGSSPAPGSSGRTQVGVSLISEYEYTEVSIGGRIELDDGTTIEMSMSITMERSYQQTTASVLQERGLLKDPLAISFNGESVSLSSSVVFEFDLNSDGQTEQLSALNSNAGFIALDRNADGIINNGSELFGANSGNGFADLANFDEDSNGFIDSGDSIFKDLFAFNPNSGLMSKLVDLGVGALYTQSVDSPFKLNDTNNRNLGVIRSSGFYLNEDRSAGLLQQVDLRS